ncbi:hypothetical protein VP1G_03800 [Cytospora mali]|uniref:K Homology domain-containing protein n=1 Tax=Cytospora mali TaxID=578113 RepID=A0A194UXN4_CYTMA|nr:hypothetical protein VP1G_03800 [Valsa mali var. pyri (nom. inval.)]
MSGFAGIFYRPEDTPRACYERMFPRDILGFSNGRPIDPPHMERNGLQCLQSTVTSPSFESAKPSTHYWFSKDMDWWFSAAKQVFYDVKAFLEADNFDNVPVNFLDTLRLLRHPQRDRVNWLSSFVYHLELQRLGAVLHPARQWIRSPCDESRQPDTLRFDVFLVECWAHMGLASQQDRRTLRDIDNVQEQFRMHWRWCISYYEKFPHELHDIASQIQNSVTRYLLLLPEPNSYSHVRTRLGSIQEQSRCWVHVPPDEAEPIQITGTELGIEMAKHLILGICREGMTRLDAGCELALVRLQYITAKRALFNQINGVAGGGIDEDEAGLACSAAQDQIFRSQACLQTMAFAALQRGDTQGGNKIIQVYGELVGWDRRAARGGGSGQTGDSSGSSSASMFR